VIVQGDIFFPNYLFHRLNVLYFSHLLRQEPAQHAKTAHSSLRPNSLLQECLNLQGVDSASMCVFLISLASVDAFVNIFLRVPTNKKREEGFT
jgi:hypothetical protein